jgi:hypothetical protein
VARVGLASRAEGPIPHTAGGSCSRTFASLMN